MLLYFKKGKNVTPKQKITDEKGIVNKICQKCFFEVSPEKLTLMTIKSRC